MLLHYRLKMLGLIVGDLLALVVAIYGAFIIRFGASEAVFFLSGDDSWRLLKLYGAYAAVLIATGYVFEVYNLAKKRSATQILSNIGTAVVLSFILLSSAFFLYPQIMIGRGVLAILLLFYAGLQVLWHAIYSHGVKHQFLAENILVLGDGASARQVGEIVKSTSAQFHHRLVGYLSYNTGRSSVLVPAGEILGGAENFDEIIRKKRVSQIIVALPEKRQMELIDDSGLLELVCKDAGARTYIIETIREQEEQISQMLLRCKFKGIEVVRYNDFYEQITGKVLLKDESVDDELIYSSSLPYKRFYAGIKRVLDIGAILVGVTVVAPFFPLIALLIKLDSSGPIFYRQIRVGQWGREFNLYKFRSMPHNAELTTGAVWAQVNDPRISRIGRFLRKWRIDELPQFYNLLNGDMSLIGPRPERPEFVKDLALKIPHYQKRHFVKPGITGWAQVKYPYGSSTKDAYEKLCYDLYYIKHSSPMLDLKILLETFKVVIFGLGR